MTQTTPDTERLTREVRELYREVALRPEQEFHFDLGRALAERLGYPPEWLDAVPAEAVDRFAGVGYFFDLANLRTGETVLDLGSGAGMDSLVAAGRVGPSGRVIGVDMTEAQLDQANRAARDGGYSQVEFHLARIETAPVPDASVDAVITNGVVNLVPDKAEVFREVARMLRPGGRVALADIVSEAVLPEQVVCDASLWASCIGGAMALDSYQEAIERAGLSIGSVRVNSQYRFLSDGASDASRKWGVKSISLLAHRP